MTPDLLARYLAGFLDASAWWALVFVLAYVGAYGDVPRWRS